MRFLGINLVAAVFMLFVANCGDDSGNKTTDLAKFVQVEDLSTVFVCVSSCTTNAQCQNSCPAPSSGTSCCDTGTNACFTAQATTCPAPVDMTVVTMPY